MDPSLDVIGTLSPPVSPQRRDGGSTSTTPTQAARRKLKRLSLVSGGVFTNTEAVEDNVKDAMQDNPSFASPSRSDFHRDDETLGGTSASSVSKAPLIKEDAPSTPTTAKPSEGAPRTRPRGSSQLITDSAVKSRTPTVRTGYRNSIYGTGAVQSKTPQARRARRSSSRDRATLDPAFEERDGKDTARSSLDSAFSRSTAAQLAPGPTSLPSPAPPSAEAATRRNGPLTLIEKHADLLAYIAQKEREANDARKVYERKLQELEEVKKRWEAITARQGFHSTTTPSASFSAKTGHQVPMPIRRTASNSSTGSAGSVGMQNGVLPLIIPPVNYASGTTTSSSSFGSAHPGQNTSSAMVEGSRRLFGHLLDSLSDLTATTATEEAPSVDGSNGGEADERKRETREMRTLSLIAGVGTTAKHTKNGSTTNGDRQVRGSISPSCRRMSVVSTSSNRSTELPPLREGDSSQLIPIDDTSTGGAVDFTNIWDGLAPQARDWKEKLGSVMGVTAPTIQSSQKKASEFLTTNLTHTLDFFSQALPTPYLNASSHGEEGTHANELGANTKETRLQRRPLSTRGVSDRSATGERMGKSPSEAQATEIPWNW